MKFEIIGSGGCVALPKPLCNCEICQEAREKGRPYSRYGCSIFLHDINLLIDTPEDIVHAINNSSIQKIDTVLFSHLDPDHTLGFRVFEHLRLNWFDVSEGRECSNPIDVVAMPHVMEDLNAIKSIYGSFLDYYENSRNLIRRRQAEKYQKIDEVEISFIKIERSTIFVFESKDKKLIYAPCDVKPFPNEDIFTDADVLIIGNTFVGETLKDGYILSEDNPLREDLFSMEEVMDLKKKFNIKRVIVTHLEEDWGKSYDDYTKLEDKYDNVQFAYDGMVIDI
ncbi:MBL fold metallo-hydrolase [Wukongibacter baidiensis]|uniref:MBL fold metallo-hydrolase n=1 Tax=Wukongibacter baidiensis TaxID=1723361 RepID=UPI003D7FD7BB